MSSVLANNPLIAAQLAGVGEKKRTKFGAKKETVDGYVFDSMMEARRYGQLKYLQIGKLISKLRIHPKYSIDVNGQHICTVIVDFDYLDHRTNEIVVEDVKGARTALFILKKKLMLACHGIEVKEVRA